MFPFAYYPWPYAYNFAAIAYDPLTGRYGIATNASDAWTAQQWALGYCGTSSCQSVVWVANGCASIAVGANPGAFGWSFNPTRYGADVTAVQFCSRQDINCRTVAWVCGF